MKHDNIIEIEIDSDTFKLLINYLKITEYKISNISNYDKN